MIEIKINEYETIILTNYDDLVNYLIRQKYSVSQELSLLRQKEVKSTEWLEYNNYCEQCKAKAKEIIAEQEN